MTNRELEIAATKAVTAWIAWLESDGIMNNEYDEFLEPMDDLRKLLGIPLPDDDAPKSQGSLDGTAEAGTMNPSNETTPPR
jgi:hypothetical protein